MEPNRFGMVPRPHEKPPESLHILFPDLPPSRSGRRLYRAGVTVALYLVLTAAYTLLVRWRMTASWDIALVCGLIAAFVSLAGAFLKRGLPKPGEIDRAGRHPIRFGGRR